MQLKQVYDAAIVGGGLAGLAAGIRLARLGHSVVLFEKEKYPFHKVCGEYISLESWNFLQELGLPLKEMRLPVIDTLLLTAPNGKAFRTKLPLGGFGISRYKIDALLADIAKSNGVHVVDETKVNEINFNEKFTLEFQSKTVSTNKVDAMLCCASYGKRSNLDIKWNRNFLKGVDKKLDNYVAVKYQIKTNWQKNLIGLHNFENGYCGISKIEDDRYCLCYMSKAEMLKKSNNSIHQLENDILYKNPHLKNIFQSAEICNEFPVTISQINFNKKTLVEDHMLMIGDAGGMITPLCGNGMSIALQTGKIASELMSSYLNGNISRVELETDYQQQWKNNFARRLRTGRMIQRFFGSKLLSNLFVQTFRLLPFLAKPVVKMTHGKSF
ncbi:MAG: NAD(P)/FAD-dependent oxidoreductase [Flavisolibacter sp.]